MASNTAQPLRNPTPGRHEWTTKSTTIFSTKALVNGLWYLFDVLVLFRMGTIYLHRFEDFAYCTKRRDPEGDEEINRWRDEQQKEWDRLSTTKMALIGTMNAGIIKIAPDVKGAAPSLWLGAAGLSLCGVFLVQYYSVRAFPMSNAQLINLVSIEQATEVGPDGKEIVHKLGSVYIIHRTAVAMAISGPPLMALWSSALFVAGIVVFVAQTTFDRTRFKVFALLPLGAGVVAVLISLLFGEIMGVMMYREKQRDRKDDGEHKLGTRWCREVSHRPGYPLFRVPSVDQRA